MQSVQCTCVLFFCLASPNQHSQTLLSASLDAAAVAVAATSAYVILWPIASDAPPAVWVLCVCFAWAPTLVCKSGAPCLVIHFALFYESYCNFTTHCFANFSKSAKLLAQCPTPVAEQLSLLNQQSSVDLLNSHVYLFFTILSWSPSLLLLTSNLIHDPTALVSAHCQSKAVVLIQPICKFKSLDFSFSSSLNRHTAPYELCHLLLI